MPAAHGRPVASSARCSTATPAASASARPTRWSRPARRYLPGTMVLETTWGTRTGLGHRPRRAADRARGTTTTSARSTHRRAPTDYDADHVLLRTLRCVNGSVEMKLDCDAGLRLRPRARRAGSTRRRLPRGRRRRPRAATSSCTLTTDLRLGFEGSPRPRAHDDARRRHRASSRCRGPSTTAPTDLRRGLRAPRAHRRLLARVALARRVPRPPVAHATCSAAR